MELMLRGSFYSSSFASQQGSIEAQAASARLPGQMNCAVGHRFRYVYEVGANRNRTEETLSVGLVTRVFCESYESLVPYERVMVQ